MGIKHLDKFKNIGHHNHACDYIKEVRDLSMATDLLKAQHIGIRDLKEHLSTRVLNEPLVITDRGTPVSVNLPYSDMLELVDILDELSDPGIVETILEGKKAIKEGTEGVPVSNLFDRIKAQRNEIRG